MESISMPFLVCQNDSAVKSKYRSRIRAHRAAERVTQGVYWHKGRGSAIGCFIHGTNQFAYQRKLGIPEVLAGLEYCIFEAMPQPWAIEWPVRFLSAIRPGADLAKMWPQFAQWLLEDKNEGLIRFTGESSLGAELCLEMRDAIANVARLFRESCDDADDWRQASRRARQTAHRVEVVALAAEAAAFAAESSTTEYLALHAAAHAVLSAAGAAAAQRASQNGLGDAVLIALVVTLAAADAAVVASERASAETACSITYIRHSEKLLELLRTA